MRSRLILALAFLALAHTAAFGRDHSLSRLIIINESPMPFTVAPDYTRHELRVLPEDQRPPDSVVVAGNQQADIPINNGSWEMTGDGRDVASFYVNKGHEYHLVLATFRQEGTIGLTGTLDDGYHPKMAVLYQQRDDRPHHRPPPPPYGPPPPPPPQYHDPRLTPEEELGAGLGHAFADLLGGLLTHDDRPPRHGPPPPPPPPRRHDWDDRPEHGRRRHDRW